LSVECVFTVVESSTAYRPSNQHSSNTEEGEMKNVALRIAAQEDPVGEAITASFDDADLALLQKYCASLDRLRETTLLQNGLAPNDGTELDFGRHGLDRQAIFERRAARATSRFAPGAPSKRSRILRKR
jgi:hypothetical protein